MWPGTPVALWMKRHNRWMWQRQRAQTVYNNRKYVRPAVKTFKSVSCCGSRALTSRRRQLPRCSPHQEAPRRKGPAGFHRINKTVTHKDRRRKGQTLVHNRRATARPKELSECRRRTDSHTQTHTHRHLRQTCARAHTDVCVCLWRQPGFQALEWRDLSKRHSPILPSSTNSMLMGYWELK